MTHLLTITPQLLDIGDDYGDLAFLARMVVFFIIGCLIGFTLYILFLLTLQNTLKTISPQNRKLAPGKVWLLLVPFFSFVWIFFIVNGIAQSIYQEFRSRGVPLQNKPTLGLGRTLIILMYVHLIFFIITFVLKYILVADEFFVILTSFIVFLILLAFGIIWILYWIKVNEYKKRILMLPKADQQAQGRSKYFTS